MAVIRIERVPVSVGGLGLLGFDHLQLVLQQDDYDPRLRQDNWYVMEGVREPGADGFVLGVEGGNGITTLSAANGGLTGSDLTAAIADAWAKDEAWEKANPGEKPPLGDGIPWGTWTDYAPQCDVGLVTLMKTDAKVEISYTFPDDADANYTDVLLLKKIDQPDYGTGFWRIDNIAYSAGSDLKAQLVAAFEGL